MKYQLSRRTNDESEVNEMLVEPNSLPTSEQWGGKKERKLTQVEPSTMEDLYVDPSAGDYTQAPGQTVLPQTPVFESYHSPVHMGYKEKLHQIRHKALEHYFPHMNLDDFRRILAHFIMKEYSATTKHQLDKAIEDILALE